VIPNWQTAFLRGMLPLLGARGAVTDPLLAMTHSAEPLPIMMSGARAHMPKMYKSSNPHEMRNIQRDPQHARGVPSHSGQLVRPVGHERSSCCSTTLGTQLIIISIKALKIHVNLNSTFECRESRFVTR
jgi:hypothetical protein